MKINNILLLFFLFGIYGLLQLNAAVSLGVDELEARKFDVLRGKKIGLVTNVASRNSRGEKTIDLLRGVKGVQLIALYGPEHGVTGKVKAGVSVPSQRDSKTGIWIHSLYGDTRKPTPKMLQGIDLLVYDLQDIGVRSYTFIGTLGYVMEAASEKGIPVVVLDRPNPLGGERIEGPRLDPAFKSFVGMYNIPYVYGLTCGELAQWINARYLKKPCQLTVIPMKQWNRWMTWEETGLTWIPTSPNIPRVESIFGYVATGLLGEVGIANGANEGVPFEVVAGEGWNVPALLKHLKGHSWHGIELSPYRYRSTTGKWAGTLYSGVRFKIDPHSLTHLTAIPFYVLEHLKEVVPKWNLFGRVATEKIVMFDKINGSNRPRIAYSRGVAASEIERSWDAGEERWKMERKPYLLY